MPGVDYESMLSELGKFGASFVLATQSLAKLDDLSRTMRDTLLANVGCLCRLPGGGRRRPPARLGAGQGARDRGRHHVAARPPLLRPRHRRHRAHARLLHEGAQTRAGRLRRRPQHPRRGPELRHAGGGDLAGRSRPRGAAAPKSSARSMQAITGGGEPPAQEPEEPALEAPEEQPERTVRGSRTAPSSRAASTSSLPSPSARSPAKRASNEARRGSPAAAPGRHASPRPPGGGRRLRLVEGSAVYRAASAPRTRGAHRLGAPRAPTSSPRPAATSSPPQGIERLAQQEGTTVDDLLRQPAPSRPGSGAPCSSGSTASPSSTGSPPPSLSAAHPLRFRWLRAMPMDAAVGLPGNRVVAVVRQGSRDRQNGVRQAPLAAQGEGHRPGAALLLMPDETRLRHARRLLAGALVPRVPRPRTRRCRRRPGRAHLAHALERRAHQPPRGAGSS